MSHFIYPFISWWMFPIFAIVVMLLWTSGYNSFCKHVLFLLGKYLEVDYWIIWWSMVNLLRSCQTVSKSCNTILHSHWQSRIVPVSPCPHQHLLLCVFWILVVLMNGKHYLFMVLLCVSLMMLDIFSSAYWLGLSSLEKCLFKSSAYKLVIHFFYHTLIIWGNFILMLFVLFNVEL
jgi:hypothetical protein